jgi:hypothetical protein
VQPALHVRMCGFSREIELFRHTGGAFSRARKRRRTKM